MRITKLGHCCLVLEDSGVKLLTDPGTFTTAQDEQTGLDAIIITHEHGDHFHLDSLKVVLHNNPQATVITNSAVGKLLEQEGIAYTRVGDGESTELKGMSIEGTGTDHEPIYQTMGLVENTSYLIGGKFFFPGDAFHNPGRPVDILALPTAGPWMKMSQAVDYAKALKPRIAFGVHDGMLVPSFRGFVGTAMQLFVPDTQYVSLGDGETREF